MFSFNWFPGTNMHDLDLDWVITTVREMNITVNEFVKTFSNPVIVENYRSITNKSKIYLYTGDDAEEYLQDNSIRTWYKNHWYFWSQSQMDWIDGGLYGAADFTEQDILDQLPPEIGYNFRRVDRQFIINDGTNATNQHGGTVISENEVVYALLDPDYLNNNVAHIISHNLSDHTYTEKAQLIIGHCDSMAYDRDSGKLYIAPAYHAIDGVEVQDGSIYVYDYRTMTQLDVMLNINANSVAYDNDNKELYYTTFLDEWKDAVGNTLFTFDASWSSSRQGIFVYDNGFYLVTALPNNIREYDKDGNIIRDIPIAAFYDWYIVGEMQWAGTIGDRLFFGSMTDCEDQSERYPQVWETNLKTNIRPSHDFAYSHVMTTMHVDAASTSYNPTGSAGQKFKSINEAMLYANIRKTITEMDLYDGTYKGRINCNMAVIGNGNTILEPTFKSCCARIANCAEVNNAVIATGCYVESPIVFTPDTGSYYLTRAYSEQAVAGTGWTIETSHNFIRAKTVFLKLSMKNNGTPSSNWTTIVTGYPAPKENWYFMGLDKNGNRFRLRVNTNGELEIANLSGGALDFDDTFTYPLI